MATGTGKTYTAFQIIWRLWKSGAKKRIEIRQKRGMTQVELGERLGFPQNRVSEIENGSRSPTLVTILRLAVALDCKPSALLTSFDGEDLPKLLPK